jgi:sec-independent protein translocase protein TatB
MFDIGWTEMAVIAVIAILVIGPKELPVVLRSLGRWAGKARRTMRDIQSGIEEMMQESEISNLKDDLNAAAEHFDVKEQIKKSLDLSEPRDGASDGGGPVAEGDKTASRDKPGKTASKSE